MHNLVGFAFISSCLMWLVSFSRNTGHEPGQCPSSWPAFNKNCFKFGSEIVAVVLFSPCGINTPHTPVSNPKKLTGFCCYLVWFCANLGRVISLGCTRCLLYSVCFHFHTQMWMSSSAWKINNRWYVQNRLIKGQKVDWELLRNKERSVRWGIANSYSFSVF